MQYEKRICCFIDILGFKNHINQTINDNGEDNIEKIIKIKSILELSKNITDDLGFCKSKVITYFSDSIVLSYKYDEPSQLFYTLLDLLYVSFELANKGFLTRGGVSIGKLIHTQDFIFGPALNEAYEIESKKANFPRIIVDEKVIKNGIDYRKKINSKKDENESIMNILTLDEDGLHYIDYIGKSSSEFDDLEYDLYYYLTRLQSNYFQNYNNEIPEVKKKLDWLKVKLNTYIRQIKSNLDNPSFKVEIVELYSSLKEL